LGSVWEKVREGLGEKKKTFRPKKLDGGIAQKSKSGTNSANFSIKTKNWGKKIENFRGKKTHVKGQGGEDDREEAFVWFFVVCRLFNQLREGKRRGKVRGKGREK
jgi:hypothetical protein